jgi:glycosyltransferase involved in cell wall biosynthesis
VSYFYAALLSLINEHKITDFEIRFVGVGLSFHIPENLLKYIVKTDRIPHKEAISEMTKADALLFMFPNNGWKGVYSGKLFEYLACRKPIIALTDPDDVAAELIRKCNSGFIATFDKVTEISEAFLKAYNLWKNKDKLEYNNAIIEQHHRKNQVAKLEKLIIELKK